MATYIIYIYIETWMAVWWRVDLQCLVGVGILLGFWQWLPWWRFSQGRSPISAVPGTFIPRAGSAAEEKAADSGSPTDHVWNSVWKNADTREAPEAYWILIVSKFIGSRSETWHLPFGCARRKGGKDVERKSKRRKLVHQSLSGETKF